MDAAVWLVVGLGNPGPAYAGTRHNVGFAVLDRLAARHGAAFGAGALAASWARILIAGSRVVLLKPQAFMNASGPPVAAWRARLAIPHSQVLVVHDDLDLPLGRIRIVQRAGDGGHRGVASVQAALGAMDLPRVRVGIGRPGGAEAAVDRVLSEFEASEAQTMTGAIERAADAVEAVIDVGPVAAMNRFNVRETEGGPSVLAEGAGESSRVDVDSGE